MKSSDIVLILAAIIFPPVSTFLVCGCGPDLLIGILLCIFGYLPGAIHALWLIYRKLEAEERFGVDGFVYSGYGHFEQAVALAGESSAAPPSYGATVNGTP